MMMNAPTFQKMPGDRGLGVLSRNLQPAVRGIADGTEPYQKGASAMPRPRQLFAKRIGGSLQSRLRHGAEEWDRNFTNEEQSHQGSKSPSCLLILTVTVYLDFFLSESLFLP
jgi:hypothetical protein